MHIQDAIRTIEPTDLGWLVYDEITLKNGRLPLSGQRRMIGLAASTTLSFAPARLSASALALDYSKELTKWSASDLQREASRRLGRRGNAILDLVREAGHEVDEVAFNDALTFNLRRGRFLLLIVGDGIREGVEAIAEDLQSHAGLHFTMGLVEMPIYLAPDGSRLVVPCVLAKTLTVIRSVISLPEGMTISEDEDEADTILEQGLARMKCSSSSQAGNAIRVLERVP